MSVVMEGTEVGGTEVNMSQRKVKGCQWEWKEQR